MSLLTGFIVFAVLATIVAVGGYWLGKRADKHDFDEYSLIDDGIADEDFLDNDNEDVWV